MDRGCQRLVHTGAVSVLPIPHVPGSAQGVCASRLDGLRVIQADWSVGNTVAVVTGVGLSRAVVNSISLRQTLILQTRWPAEV